MQSLIFMRGGHTNSNWWNYFWPIAGAAGGVTAVTVLRCMPKRENGGNTAVDVTAGLSAVSVVSSRLANTHVLSRGRFDSGNLWAPVEHGQLG